MAEQSYEINEVALDNAFSAIVGGSLPDQRHLLRSFLGQYLAALKIADTPPGQEPGPAPPEGGGNVRSTRGGRGHDR